MTAPSPVFLYGTLCDLELLEIVAGEPQTPVSATLPDHAVYWAKGQSFPIIAGAAQQVASGILITPSARAKARLDFYELGFGYRLEPCEVIADGQPMRAEVYFPEPGGWETGAPWSLTDWQNTFGTLTREAASDYIRLEKTKAPNDAAQLFDQVRTRAASRLRARNLPSPQAFEPARHRDDVTIHASERPLVAFFDVVQENLSFQTFKGTASAEVERITILGGDAVTVLPYDPATDRVLVIRQFRHGAYSRGDLNPWCLEPPAGRIDPFESAEEAALRELQEEAGVVPRALHKIASYYPTPAAVSEHLTSFVATADLSNLDGRIGGLKGEAEDIMAHVIPFEEALSHVQTGAANTGPLILSLLWLQQHRHTIG